LAVEVAEEKEIVKCVQVEAVGQERKIARWVPAVGQEKEIAFVHCLLCPLDTKEVSVDPA
jgi:hypothetical protein